MNTRITKEDLENAAKKSTASGLGMMGMKAYDVGADIFGGLSNALGIGGEEGKKIRTQQDIERARDISFAKREKEGELTRLDSLPKLGRNLIKQEVKQAKAVPKKIDKAGNLALRAYEEQLDAWATNPATLNAYSPADIEDTKRKALENARKGIKDVRKPLTQEVAQKQLQAVEDISQTIDTKSPVELKRQKQKLRELSGEKVGLGEKVKYSAPLETATRVSGALIKPLIDFNKMVDAGIDYSTQWMPERGLAGSTTKALFGEDVANTLIGDPDAERKLSLAKLPKAILGEEYLKQVEETDTAGATVQKTIGELVPLIIASPETATSKAGELAIKKLLTPVAKAVGKGVSRKFIQGITKAVGVGTKEVIEEMPVSTFQTLSNLGAEVADGKKTLKQALLGAPSEVASNIALDFITAYPAGKAFEALGKGAGAIKKRTADIVESVKAKKVETDTDLLTKELDKTKENIGQLDRDLKLAEETGDTVKIQEIRAELKDTRKTAKRLTKEIDSPTKAFDIEEPPIQKQRIPQAQEKMTGEFAEQIQAPAKVEQPLLKETEIPIKKDTELKPQTPPVKQLDTEIIPDASIKPKVSEQIPVKTQERKFAESIKKAETVDPEVKKAFEKIDTTYEIKGNRQSILNAKKRIKEKGIEKSRADFLEKEIKKITDDDIFEGIETAKQLQNSGRIEEAVEMFDRLAKTGTEAGRQVQAFKTLSYGNLTPESAVYMAQKKISTLSDKPAFKQKIEKAGKIEGEIKQTIDAIKRKVGKKIVEEVKKVCGL